MSADMDFPRPHGVVMAERAREATDEGVTLLATEPTLEEALDTQVAWQIPGGRLHVGTMRECPTVELEYAAKTWWGYIQKPVWRKDRLTYWRCYRAARLVLDSREVGHA